MKTVLVAISLGACALQSDAIDLNPIHAVRSIGQGVANLARAVPDAGKVAIGALIYPFGGAVIPVAKQAADFGPAYIKEVGSNGLRNLVNPFDPNFIQLVFAIRKMRDSGLISSEAQCSDFAGKTATGVGVAAVAELGPEASQLTVDLANKLGTAACGTAFAMDTASSSSSSAVAAAPDVVISKGSWHPAAEPPLSPRLSRSEVAKNVDILLGLTRATWDVYDEHPPAGFEDGSNSVIDPIDRTWDSNDVLRGVRGLPTHPRDYYVLAINSGTAAVPVMVCSGWELDMAIGPDLSLINIKGKPLGSFTVDRSGKYFLIGKLNRGVHADAQPTSYYIFLDKSGNLGERLKENSDSEQINAIRGFCKNDTSTN